MKRVEYTLLDRVAYFAKWLITILFVLAILSRVLKGAEPADAICRIVNQGDGSTGSGALVRHDFDDDGNPVGLVLTCGHLFRDAPRGKIIVTFRSGRAHHARLLEYLYPDPDLAILVVWDPHPDAIPVTGEVDQECYACGYGQTGELNCVVGPPIGTAETGSNTRSLVVRGNQLTRPGDSGGPVINSKGELAGVIWGARPGEGTYAAYGKDVTELLTKWCPGGTCNRPSAGSRTTGPTIPWTQPQLKIPSQFPPASSSKQPAAHSSQCKSCKDDFQKVYDRLAALESNPPSAGRDGKDGQPGRDGKDAVLDYDTLADEVKSRLGEGMTDAQVRAIINAYMQQWVQDNPLRVNLQQPDGSRLSKDIIIGQSPLTLKLPVITKK